MYSSFHNTSSLICSEIREDIFSLLGNSGKTLFAPEVPLFPYSFQFSFGKTLQKTIQHFHQLAYKKPLLYIAIAFSALMFSPMETSFAAEALTSTQKTFIVTAYYSPLPSQQSYQMGSYEADIRLNGGGAQGASGTPVFTGMIAAPKTYAFGTQIFFEGLGLGRVEDRGGAIVAAFEKGQPYDRIDIWVGYGDEGFYRAKKWGRRVVQGRIITPEEAANNTWQAINIAGIGKTGIDSVNLALFPEPNTNLSSTLNQDILDIFAELGYSVKNNDTEAMIIQFQLDNKIIQSKNDDGTGIYGPKTRSALSALYSTYQKERKSEIQSYEKNQQMLVDAHNSWQEKYHKAEQEVEKFQEPILRKSGENVRLLQKFLSEKSIYTGSIDGTMSLKTLSAIRKYQKSRNISETGKLDTSTKSAMIEDIIVTL